MIYIKNPHATDTINYQGQDILAGEYFLVPDSNLNWKSDSFLITDIVNGVAIVAKSDDGTKDISDVNEALNWLKGIQDIEIDDEGRQTVRRATAKKGWHYSAITAEIKTSTVDTYNKDHHGVDLGWVSIKLYDSSDVEITDPANYGNTVKTVATITPSHDFEVIEGDVYHHTRPTQDIRLWTLAGITALGDAGTKVFANGINLRFMSPDDHIESDGRSSKFMNQYTDIPGVGTLPSNQFQFIFKHPAGFQHELMILLETYKQ